MPIDAHTHRFEEVTYQVDHLNVKALMMTPYQSVDRIAVYLRGGKGQVGRVRAKKVNAVCRCAYIGCWSLLSR